MAIGARVEFDELARNFGNERNLYALLFLGFIVFASGANILSRVPDAHLPVPFANLFSFRSFQPVLYCYPACFERTLISFI
jgi:hypothetical protein